ncbi:MAG: FecR family protein [Flavisolibacter sp.]
MDNNTRLSKLFDLYYQGKASEAETGELMQMLEMVSDEELEGLMRQVWKENERSEPFFDADVRQNFLAGLKKADTESESKHTPGRVRRMSAWKYAVAAAILVIVSMTVILLTQKDVQAPIAQKPAADSVVNHIVPGGDRATLTLADGRVVFLDSAAKGTLTEQGGISVINLDGQLAYHPEGQSTEVLYNTVTTPRGGQYQLVLADGSKVWLNAASSIRFPTSFPGAERTVELSGEGYFEVAHDAAKPFHVKVDEMDVEVLGTHFNINSYSDEPSVKTTLLEGRVKVASNEKHVFLNPGQQAVVASGNASQIIIKNDVDLDGVIAWKNGYFHFDGSTLEEVMRQIARWYQVDVAFERAVPNRKFGGDIARSANLSDVLKVLQESDIGFQLKGRKIIVTN